MKNRIDLGTHWLILSLVEKQGQPQPDCEQEICPPPEPQRPEWIQKCLTTFRSWGYTENDMCCIASEGLNRLPVEDWDDCTKKKLTDLYRRVSQLSSADRTRMLEQTLRTGE